MHVKVIIQHTRGPISFMYRTVKTFLHGNDYNIKQSDPL